MDSDQQTTQPTGGSEHGLAQRPAFALNASQSPADLRAGSSVRAWLVLLAVTAVLLTGDLVSKWWAFEHVAGFPVTVIRAQVLDGRIIAQRGIQSLIPAHEPVVVVPNVLNWTLVLNPGAVFGIGAGKRWFFVVFTALAMGFAVYMFARWTSVKDRWAHLAVALLVAGGLGNLYDRIVFGCVRDFIHPLPGVKFPGGWSPFGSRGEVWPYVSNVADLYLIIGIGTLMIFLWRKERTLQAAQAANAADRA